MAAHFETDNIDMLVTQWDYRSELARQAGLTLANTRDRQVAMALLAACSVGQIANDARGLAAAAFQDPGIISTSILASGSVTDAEGLKVLQEIENYLVTCQENDIPVENVYCAVTPKVFQVIRALGIPRSSGGTVATATALNYNGALFGGSDDYGGAGASISVGMNSLMDSLDYMGVKIIKTNHLAKVDHNVTANNIGSSKYNLNAGANSYAGSNGQGFSSFSVYGIIFQTPAVAGLSLQGMKVDTVQDVRRNTQFTVASMMKGTGLIRPEMCKALISGTTPTGGTPVTTAGREGLRNHLNGNLASGTTAHNNLTNGFAAEYAQA
jgi:hypothetical protein